MPPSEAARIQRAAWEDKAVDLAPLLILAYFALQVVLRVTGPGALGLDEAEQVVAAQSLALGYGVQPPLYTWLQIGVFAVTGTGVAGLALLKNALLATAYLGVWAAALRISGDRRVAAVAALSLLLIPPVAWEAQRALTHSVLALAVSSLILLTALRCREGGRSWDFALLGALAAAGILSKGNVAFLLAGLAGAVVLEGGWRERRWLVSLAVMAALLVAPLAWMSANAELVGRDARKFGMEATGLAARAEGLLALGNAVLACVALLLVAHGALFWWRRAEGREPGGRMPGKGMRGGAGRFVLRAVLLSLAAVAVAVLATGATEVKERWLQPFLFLAVLPLALYAAPRLSARALRAFLGLAGVLALAVSVAIAWNLRYGGDDPSYHVAPFGEAEADLPEGEALVIAEDDFIGGNLRLVAPRLHVLTPQKPGLCLGSALPVLVVWGEEPSPPEPLGRLSERVLGAPPPTEAEGTVIIPYPAPHENRDFVLRWASAGREGAGACGDFPLRGGA